MLPKLNAKDSDNLVEGLWYICIICAIILFAKCNGESSSAAYLFPH